MLDNNMQACYYTITASEKQTQAKTKTINH